LEHVIGMLPSVEHPDLLVGSDTLDDAAVYRLTDEIALVQTVDFFTPVVDDPYDFGRIAAANALSDVYAMGARPLTALNIVCFPSGTLPLESLGRILQGGSAVARLAEVTIVGGHTIDDPEPKYGMAVTGLVVPGTEITNAAVRPGDVLILTKPLGTGIVATAIKQGKASPEAISEATEVMAELNKDAAEVARAHGVRAVTDITGFGLLGHLGEMCRASGVSMEIWFDRLPFLAAAQSLVRAGVAPGGTGRNLEYVASWTVFDESLEQWQRLLAADAQTSGGLVLAVREDSVAAVLDDLRGRQVSTASVIGRAGAPVGRSYGPVSVRAKAAAGTVG
jgi:selenide,water dikinase